MFSKEHRNLWETTGNMGSISEEIYLFGDQFEGAVGAAECKNFLSSFGNWEPIKGDNLGINIHNF